MGRKALIVGLDFYTNFDSLPSCVNDAREIAKRLSRNSDGSLNYSTLVITAENAATAVTRAQLREALRKLFECSQADQLLFYFSGHGTVSLSGGWLATSDAETSDIGVAMDEVLSFANNGKPRPADIIMLLDCCNAGNLGNPSVFGEPSSSNITAIRENITIIAASLPLQTAAAGRKLSPFTEAMIDALDGGAGDHQGLVNASALYSYVERRFGEWESRPIFKSNITEVTAIRRCAPLIETHKLRQLLDLFPSQHHLFQLDPEFEPQDEHGNLPAIYDADKFAICRLLKEFRNVGLVTSTVLGEDFYFAARNSHTVELTTRGQEYWYLIKNNKI